MGMWEWNQKRERKRTAVGGDDWTEVNRKALCGRMDVWMAHTSCNSLRDILKPPSDTLIYGVSQCEQKTTSALLLFDTVYTYTHMNTQKHTNIPEVNDIWPQISKISEVVNIISVVVSKATVAIIAHTWSTSLMISITF